MPASYMTDISKYIYFKRDYTFATHLKFARLHGCQQLCTIYSSLYLWTHNLSGRPCYCLSLVSCCNKPAFTEGAVAATPALLFCLLLNISPLQLYDLALQ